LQQSANTIIVTAAVTTTSQMSTSINPQTEITKIPTADLQSSLTTQLSVHHCKRFPANACSRHCLWFVFNSTLPQALVDPSVSAGLVQSIVASPAEDVPKPEALPAQPPTNAPPAISAASAASALPQLLMLLLVVFLL
jgi:hypothetical protein